MQTWPHQTNGGFDARMWENISQMHPKQTLLQLTPLGTPRLPRERENVGMKIKMLDNFFIIPDLRPRVWITQKIASSFCMAKGNPSHLWPPLCPAPLWFLSTFLQLLMHWIIGCFYIVFCFVFPLDNMFFGDKDYFLIISASLVP